jgi:hypothetical protein
MTFHERPAIACPGPTSFRRSRELAAQIILIWTLVHRTTRHVMSIPNGGSRVPLRLRSVTRGRDSVLSAWEQGPWRLRQYAGPAPVPRTTSRPAPVPSAETPGLRTLARP